jgi:hypothetical protein
MIESFSKQKVGEKMPWNVSYTMSTVEHLV